MMLYKMNYISKFREYVDIDSLISSGNISEIKSHLKEHYIEIFKKIILDNKEQLFSSLINDFVTCEYLISLLINNNQDNMINCFFNTYKDKLLKNPYLLFNDDIELISLKRIYNNYLSIEDKQLIYNNIFTQKDTFSYSFNNEFFNLIIEQDIKYKDIFMDSGDYLNIFKFILNNYHLNDSFIKRTGISFDSIYNKNKQNFLSYLTEACIIKNINAISKLPLSLLINNEYYKGNFFHLFAEKQKNNNQEIINMLVFIMDNKIDINLPNNQGNSIYHILNMNSSLYNHQCLSIGGDPFLCNKEGKTPLDISKLTKQEKYLTSLCYKKIFHDIMDNKSSDNDYTRRTRL